MRFDFSLTTAVIFGDNACVKVAQQLDRRKLRKVGMIADEGVAASESVVRLLESLKSSSDEVVFRVNAVAEPTYDHLDQFHAPFSAALDVIIGIGGGSSLDLAKGVAALATNPGPSISYRGFDLLRSPSLPILAIPTTAGTGSEVTPYAVFTDSASSKKLGINSDFNRPFLAILDPRLTLQCPPGPTLSAGVDAMVHAVEGFVARGSSPMSRMFSRKAVGLIYENLPKVMVDPSDIGARGQMLYGACLAGVGLMNSGAGPAGAMSYPLGVRFNVPHGKAGGAFLSAVALFNTGSGFDGYAPLGETVGIASTADGRQEASRSFARSLKDWSHRLGVPSLRSWGLREQDAESLIEETFTGLVGAIEQNPVPFTREDCRRVLLELLESD